MLSEVQVSINNCLKTWNSDDGWFPCLFPVLEYDLGSFKIIFILGKLLGPL